MDINRPTDAKTWDLGGAHFTGLASPSWGGSPDVAMWRLVIDPGTDGAEHHLTRTEVFAALSGTARVTMSGTVTTLGGGDTLVVPAGTDFALSNPGPDPFTAIVCLPVGAQAAMTAGGEPFTPAWTV